MKDRQQDIAKAAAWAVDRLAAHMQQLPSPARDVAFGNGASLSAPAEPVGPPARTIEFYPESAVVRVTTPNMRIEVFRAAPPKRTTKGLLVETQEKDASLVFQHDGQVGAYVAAPVEPLESPTTPATIQEGAIIASGVSTAPDAAGDESGASDELPAMPTAEGRGKQQTVRLKGNVYRQPSYKPAQNGTPRVLFQLAEHPDENDREKTVVHYVTSTGEWAVKIQAKDLQVGEPVRVSGYKQTYEARDRAGQVEQRERIYAVHVQQLSRQPEPKK